MTSTPILGSLVAAIRAHPRRAVAAALLVGAIAALRRTLAARRAERRSSAKASAAAAAAASAATGSGSAQRNGGASGERRARVDALFFRRLASILRIVIPSWASREVALLAALTGLLLARTWFTVIISELLGKNAQALVSQNWEVFLSGVVRFAIITLPAACVNSGLKYFTDILALRFRLRLSEHVHAEYLDGVNFYKACNLGKDHIDNADQRVTSDIDKFSVAICELYTSLFKPLLDLLLFTTKLVQNVGWQGPALMYSYFLISGLVKRGVMPSFGKMVAHESELEGIYRTAHQRLIVNSEEVAFYDGAEREKALINKALHALFTHVSRVRWLRGLVAIFDGLLVKYWASMAGNLVLASPTLFNFGGARGKSADELTSDYIRNSQHLGQVSTAVSNLVLTGNKLTTIAGYTSRVSELLEMVRHLSTSGNVPFAVRVGDDALFSPTVATASAAGGEQDDQSANLSGALPPNPFPDIQNWLDAWRIRCAKLHQQRIARRHASPPIGKVIGGGEIVQGNAIKFVHVDIVSPEGVLLVHDLDCEVPNGTNVMITGPNGCGKSSIFRVIGELWPLHNGTLIKPRKEDVQFVPQKPYLVSGTLRDQIIYPHSKADMEALGFTDDDLAHLLAVVDPAMSITSQWGWDEQKDWSFTFSGGQKQRAVMARLFYHCPQYAILDECTSAVSDEVEASIYQACKKLGITLFTISHRMSLARHHDALLSLTGRNGEWSLQTLDHSK